MHDGSIEPEEYAPPPDDEVELARVRAALEHRLLGAVASRAQIGRFILLERIGAGGMGVVHAAYDEQLERRIAIKVLHSAPDEPSPTARLVQEARAMARLSHAHVATVYEIGDHGGRTFVAMEFLRGVTLRTWQRARARAWPEVLAVYAQAGLGLAAAHAAGLVHRDFKADNAMIDEGGTVKVLDFGLARSQGPTMSDEPTLESAAPMNVGHDITRSGVLAGTPAYMSPEQLDGEPADATSDQFAFCVALWEALFGERPFVGKSVSELAVAVAAGRIATPPRDANVPTWLRTLIVRGLASDRRARWPSMAALLDALQRGRARARWRRGLAALVGVVLVAAAVAGWQRIDRQERVSACEREGESIAEVWNDNSRATLHAALAGSGGGHAETTADKVLPWLDDHARAWRTARTDACLDANVDGTWSADVLDRSEWCLDDRRMELDALVTQLSRADGEGLGNAVHAASALAPVEPCRDADLLVRLPSPPRADRRAVEAIRVDLARARALKRIGAYAEGLDVVREVLARAEAIAFPPFVAEIRLTLGELLERSGDYPQAEDVLEQAYFEAARAGALDVTAWSADQLAFVVGMGLARHDDGLRWSQHAEIALASLPDASHLREATHTTNLAAVYMAKGEFATAKTLVERALVLREAALGPEHLEIAGGLNNLANVNEAMGAFAEAKALHLRALVIQEDALGRDNPGVAMSLNGLANVVSSMGDNEEAKALHLRAIAIQEVALGPDHPELSGSLNNLAGVHWAMGEHAQAKPLVERALAIREKALGPDHPEVGAALHGLAMLHAATGEYDEAKALHERALAIREKALGPDHPELAKSLINLAAVHQRLGEYDQAKALYQRALTIRERALGPEHPSVAATRTALAELARARVDGKR